MLHEYTRLTFFREGLDARKLFACQKFKRCTATRGNVTDLRRDAGLFDRRHRIAATDDRGCARFSNIPTGPFHKIVRAMEISF